MNARDLVKDFRVSDGTTTTWDGRLCYGYRLRNSVVFIISATEDISRSVLFT